MERTEKECQGYQMLLSCLLVFELSELDPHSGKTAANDLSHASFQSPVGRTLACDSLLLCCHHCSALPAVNLSAQTSALVDGASEGLCRTSQCPPQRSASGVRALVAFPSMSWSNLSPILNTVEQKPPNGLESTRRVPGPPQSLILIASWAHSKQFNLTSPSGVSRDWFNDSSHHVQKSSNTYSQIACAFLILLHTFGYKAMGQSILSRRASASRELIQHKSLLLGTEFEQGDFNYFLKTFFLFLVTKLKWIKVYVIAYSRKVENKLKLSFH